MADLTIDHPKTVIDYVSLLEAMDVVFVQEALVEACVVNHFRRYYTTFYIKSKGEVDIAYIDRNRFWPVEVKWTNQIRQKDLKQVLKYSNSKILSKSKLFGEINGIPVYPLPLALIDLELST